jgi:hypothetical protein
MTEINDEDLRRRFSALKQQDRRHQPQFDELLNRAEQRGRNEVGSAPTLRWIAAATLIIVAAGFVVSKARDRSDERAIATAVPAITNWQSPTAGLLQTPATSVLVPRPLLSSIFDGVTTPLQLKTD